MRRHEIDTLKWDQCVEASDAARIYGTCLFLDQMADSWDAVVLDDYEAVLPLPRRQKFGISYVYALPFSGPLAIYSQGAAPVDASAFLKAIPDSIKLIDLNLDIASSGIPWRMSPRTNHVLPLQAMYSEIFVKYRASLRQMLENESDRENHLRCGISIDIILERALGSGTLKGTKPSDRHRLKALYKELQKKEKAFTLGYVQGGRIVAGAIFFRSTKRIYYMASWSDEEGRKCGAAAFMLNMVIREYAGLDMVLDFEGSDLPGIAFFFEGFGAERETYQLIQHRRFPLNLVR